MKVTVNGHLYTVGWHYESKLINKLCSKKNISHEEIKGLRKHQICEKLGIKAFPLPERTHCIITKDTGEEFIASVRRDNRDSWNRDTARIRSLEKAVMLIFPLHYSKDQSSCRKLFWDKYHGRRVNDPIANIKKLLRFGAFTMEDLRKFVAPATNGIAKEAKVFQIH